MAARDDKCLESISSTTKMVAATGACMACIAMHNASIAISCRVGPFSGDATPPAESFLGFVVHIVGKFDSDDVDEAEQLRKV